MKGDEKMTDEELCYYKALQPVFRKKMGEYQVGDLGYDPIGKSICLCTGDLWLDPLFTLPFGKFKGKDIEDLPRSYLEWLTEQEWFWKKYPEGCKAVAAEMRYRDRCGEPE